MELRLKDRLNFGKYRGKTIKQILEREVGYVNWLVSTNKNFTLSKEVEAFRVECEFVAVMEKVVGKKKIKIK